jgi:hypothetical protein
LGVKNIFFQFHNEKTSLRKKSSLSLSTKESGDYNFIIALSTNYTSGGIRLVRSSDTAAFEEEGVTYQTGEENGYEGFHTTDKIIPNNVNGDEEGQTEEALTETQQETEPEDTVHLALGQAVVYTAHTHYEVNSVTSGQM